MLKLLNDWLDLSSSTRAKLHFATELQRRLMRSIVFILFLCGFAQAQNLIGNLLDANLWFESILADSANYLPATEQLGRALAFA